MAPVQKVGANESRRSPVVSKDSSQSAVLSQNLNIILLYSLYVAELRAIAPTDLSERFISLSTPQTVSLSTLYSNSFGFNTDLEHFVGKENEKKKQAPKDILCVGSFNVDFLSSSMK